MPNKYDKGGKRATSDVVKGMSQTEQNKREILKNLAMPSNKGKVYRAIEGVVAMTTYKKYCRDDSDFAQKATEILEAIKEIRLEKMEEKLEDSVIDDDTQLSKNELEALKYTLERQGKDRGWTTRQEIKQDGDGGQIKIEYVVPPMIQNIEEQKTIEIKEDEQDNNQQEA